MPSEFEVNFSVWRTTFCTIVEGIKHADVAKAEAIDKQKIENKLKNFFYAEILTAVPLTFGF